MKKVIKKGIKLFGLSTGYIFLSALYFNSLWNSHLAMQVGVVVGLGFYVLWFYYGFKMKMGFKRGFMIGLVGSVGGLVLSVLSMISLFTSSDGSGFFIMIPWTFPLLGLFNVLPNSGMINNYFSHISVIIVILLTATGSWLGEKEQA